MAPTAGVEQKTGEPDSRARGLPEVFRGERIDVGPGIDAIEVVTVSGQVVCVLPVSVRDI